MPIKISLIKNQKYKYFDILKNFKNRKTFSILRNPKYRTILIYERRRNTDPIYLRLQKWKKKERNTLKTNSKAREREREILVRFSSGNGFDQRSNRLHSELNVHPKLLITCLRYPGDARQIERASIQVVQFSSPPFHPCPVLFTFHPPLPNLPPLPGEWLMRKLGRKRSTINTRPFSKTFKTLARENVERK